MFTQCLLSRGNRAMRGVLVCGLLVWSLAAGRSVADESPLSFGPLLGAQTQLIIRVDLNDPTGGELIGAVLAQLPDSLQQQMKMSLSALNQLRELGAEELVYGLEPPAGGAGRWFAGLRAARADQAAALAKAMLELGGSAPGVSKPQTWQSEQGPWVVIGATQQVEDILAGRTRNALDEVRAAFAAVVDAPIQFVLAPTVESRRVLSELVPNLPAELGGGSAAPFTQGLRWAALGLGFSNDNPSLRLVVQTGDAQQAHAMLMASNEVLAVLCKLPNLDPILPDYPTLSELLHPAVSDSQIIIDVSGKRSAMLIAALQPSLNAAERSATQLESVNHLKQIGLAMHIYHDAHRAFPPACVHDANDKPLYSWRVLLLPYLDQAPLYQEFHLDEPWDSEHNRKLIERMPTVFQGMQIADVSAGRTTYLAPVGEGLAFEPRGQVGITQFLDGTSNTILVVESDADHSVVWTSPQDLEFDPADAARGLARDDGRLVLLFTDGSVHRVAAEGLPETFHLYFTRADGQVPPELR